MAMADGSADGLRGVEDRLGIRADRQLWPEWESSYAQAEQYGTGHDSKKSCPIQPPLPRSYLLGIELSS